MADALVEGEIVCLTKKELRGQGSRDEGARDEGKYRFLEARSRDREEDRAEERKAG